MKFLLVGLFLSLSANAQGFFRVADTCNSMRAPKTSCFMDYNGPMRGKCQVCVEHESCFMSLNGPDQGLCQAYRENASCFMALNGTDRAWCEVLKEGKACSETDLKG